MRWPSSALVETQWAGEPSVAHVLLVKCKQKYVYMCVYVVDILCAVWSLGNTVGWLWLYRCLWLYRRLCREYRIKKCSIVGWRLLLREGLGLHGNRHWLNWLFHRDRHWLWGGLNWLLHWRGREVWHRMSGYHLLSWDWGSGFWGGALGSNCKGRCYWIRKIWH